MAKNLLGNKKAAPFQKERTLSHIPICYEQKTLEWLISESHMTVPLYLYKYQNDNKHILIFLYFYLLFHYFLCCGKAVQLFHN